MKNIKLIILCFFMSAVTQAQVQKEAGDFSDLRVSDRIVLELVQADENRIEIHGSDAENVIVKNKSGRLIIRMEISKFMQGEDIEATLYFKNLDEIKVANGATVLGSESLPFTSLSLVANKGGSLELAVKTEKLEAKASSGARIALVGTTNHLKARINSGGTIDAEELKAVMADLGVTAGGELKAHVSTTAEAKVSMGGDIYIYGNPDEITENVTAGGEVHHMD